MPNKETGLPSGEALYEEAFMRCVRQVILALWLVYLTTAPFTSAFASNCAGWVDKAVVLALDVSSSVVDSDWFLQRKGYAEAFRNSEVLAAVNTGECKRAAFAVLQWSSPHEQDLVISWRVISDQTSAFAFASEIEGMSRKFTGVTSVAGGILASIAAFDSLPYKTEWKIIDISGDGIDDGDLMSMTDKAYREANIPALPSRERARQKAIDVGIVINGLPFIGTDSDNPSGGQQWTYMQVDIVKYYEAEVRTENGILEVANGIENFAEAIRRKVVREIMAQAN